MGPGGGTCCIKLVKEIAPATNYMVMEEELILSTGDHDGMRRTLVDSDEDGEWKNAQLQKWFQVLGVLLSFLLAMAILRVAVNCLIDVTVLRGDSSSSLLRQVSQLRRWFCPWWHPRTQPQEQELPPQPPSQEAADGRNSQRRYSQRDAALDRVLMGLTPSEKRELLTSLLQSQIASEEDVLMWKQEKDVWLKKDISVDGSPQTDLELCRITNNNSNMTNAEQGRMDSGSTIIVDDGCPEEQDDDISPPPSQRSNDTTALLCPICIHDIEVGNPIISLSSTCLHRFHSHCLIQWLSTHTHITRDCPYCRTQILTQEMLEQAYRHRQERQGQPQQHHQE